MGRALGEQPAASPAWGPLGTGDVAGGVILGGDGWGWEIGQGAVPRMGKCLPNAPGTGCQPSVPAGRGALSTQEIGAWARLRHGDDLAPKHLGCKRRCSPRR